MEGKEEHGIEKSGGERLSLEKNKIKRRSEGVRRDDGCKEGREYAESAFQQSEIR